MADSRPNAATEATLGAFEEPTRRILVPLLLYKSVFLGDWFDAVASREEEPAIAALLRRMSRETLAEAISLLAVMQEWEARQAPPDRDDMLARRLHHHALLDLLAVKDGNGEAVVMAAMQAPTEELRRSMLALAAADRRHAAQLRDVLRARHSMRTRSDAGAAETVGVRIGRGEAPTLRRAVELAIEDVTQRGVAALRLAVSPEILRGLRDEGVVASDGTVAGLNVDVDFGWRGEGFAIVTSERLPLASLLDHAED